MKSVTEKGLGKGGGVWGGEKRPFLKMMCPQKVGRLIYEEWVRYSTGLIPSNIKDTLPLLK